MRTARAVRVVLLILVFGVAAVAALAQSSGAGSTAGAVPNSRVAGTISTRLVLDRFVADGRRVVGRGTIVSKWRDMHGITTVKRKHFRLTIRAPKQAQQAQTVCQILFLELGDLDLTLAGLHVTLHAFDPNEPVRLNLSADDTHGILGRLFCQLAQSKAIFGTERRAKQAARQLSKRLKNITFMRAQATIYAPDNGSPASAGTKAPQSIQVAECPVLHLILGPLHVDLLGLVVDLNKIVLDLSAIPGTLLGGIFCQLSPPPPPPPPPPAPAPAPAQVTG
jgi:hypothetical protein